MSQKQWQKIRVLDSHTGGEPTRVVLSGGPDLGTGPLAERLARLRRDHDDFRSAVVNEPRGSDVMVGALLCPPHDPACAAGVIFFNNVGYLGMCGHGTIGLIATLAHLGRLQPGEHRIETPVGVVRTVLHPSGEVTVANVASYRYASGVSVAVPGHGAVTGDVAWGGNWFFLVTAPALPFALELANVEELTAFTWRHPPGARGRTASPAPTAPKSITSSSSAPRPPAPTATTSCSAPARPTTARPAAPAPAPSSPASTPTASCRKAAPGARTASSTASSRARWSCATAS